MEVDEGSDKAAKRKFRVTVTGEELPRQVLIRFSIYTVAFSAFILLLPAIVGKGGPTVFQEGGPIELLHVILFIICTTLFVFESIQNSKRREILFILASLTIFALVRELDFLLDKLNPLGGWRLPAAFLVLATGIFAYRNWQSIWRNFIQLMSARAFPILWCGFMVAVPFAQPLGHQQFLRLILGGDYNRFVKNVIEESGELVGYLLILIGTIELVWEWRRERKVSPQPME
jgi:hypothetical protein